MTTTGLHNNPLTDPDWLLFDINLVRAQSQWLRIPSSRRRQLAFMDQRLLGENFQRIGAPLSAFAAQTAPVPECQWIFHAGHCGSTLLAQILGDTPHTGALREPQVLRTLADLKREAGLSWHRINETQWRQWFATVVGYLARPAETGQRHVLIKATSQCNNLTGSVLALPHRQRLLLLAVPLPVYLATMLRSDQHRLDVDGFLQAHMQDLLRRFPDLDIRIPDLSAPQKITITWLAHLLGFLETRERHPRRVMLLDFEQWLSDPVSVTAGICTHFGRAPMAADSVSRWLSRYAKSPGRAYSPQQRQADLTASMRQHHDEIQAAVHWLEKLLVRHSINTRGLARWLNPE